MLVGCLVVAACEMRLPLSDAELDASSEVGLVVMVVVVVVVAVVVSAGSGVGILSVDVAGSVLLYETDGCV